VIVVLLSAIIGLGASALLLTAGYLFGVKRAYSAREQLRTQYLTQAEGVKQLREQLSQRESEQDDSLRAAIQQVLTPLMQRERLAFDLAHLEAGSSRYVDLTQLLDQIAEKGNFAAVLLTDQEGWPIAASSSTRDLEGLSATASLLFVLADRLGRDAGSAAQALMIHTDTSQMILCRLFRVGDQRLSLTAVSGDAQLTATALNPALVKVEAALSNRQYRDE
jgi:predicted regulator of Ras-like GTPase activity (Roadblock/LC7/MglB family)